MVQIPHAQHAATMGRHLDDDRLAIQNQSILKPPKKKIRSITNSGPIVLPLAKIGKVLNRPHYVEEAKRQFLLHIKYLFDTKTGLFFHGWTFEDGGHNFANALWGRGNRFFKPTRKDLYERTLIVWTPKLADHRHPGVHRTPRPPAKRLLPNSSDRHAPRAMLRTAETPRRVGTLAHDLRRQRRGLVSRSLRVCRVRIRHSEGGAETLHRQGLRRRRDQGGQGGHGEYRCEGRAAAGFVRDADWRDVPVLQDDSAHEYALWPGYGDDGFGGVLAAVYIKSRNDMGDIIIKPVE